MSRQYDLINSSRVDGALSNRNLIINGGFDVWQRSENYYTGGGAAYVSADRFTTTRGRIRKPNTNGNTGEDNRGAVFDTTDGNIWVHFDYAVEDVGQKLNGKTMTFSFYAKVLSGGTTLLLQDAGGDHLDFGADRYITLTSNWERYTVTGTIVSTGSSFGIAMPRLYLNPTDSAGPRMIQVDQFQLEQGDTVTPFEHRSYGDELARCQRYYYIPPQGPLHIVGSGKGIFNVSPPVEFRTTPTASIGRTNPYVENVPWGAIGNVAGVSVSSGHLNKHGGDLLLQGTYVQAHSYGDIWLLGPNELRLDAEL